MKIFEVGVDKRILSSLIDRGFLISRGTIRNLEDLREALSTSVCDAVLLNQDRIEWSALAIQHLRHKKVFMPIIGVSSCADSAFWPERRAEFLEQGGDDLIHLYEDTRELAASLRAVARRGSGIAFDIREFFCGAARISINISTHVVSVDGKSVHLTGTELRILECITKHPGMIKSRNTIMDMIFPDESYTEDRTIDTHVKRIRRKLRTMHPDAGALIVTIYGEGYKIEVPAHVASRRIA